MKRSTKLAIVRAARRIVADHWPEVPADGGGACLYLAWAACEAARQADQKLLMLAGSAFWPRLTPKTDDGGPQVFGFQWEDGQEVDPLVVPEIHIWAGDPLTGEIVDLTAGSFPRRCRELIGQDWRAPAPPSFFWGLPSELPLWASYTATREAGQVALEMLLRALGVK